MSKGRVKKKKKKLEESLSAFDCGTCPVVRQLSRQSDCHTLSHRWNSSTVPSNWYFLFCHPPPPTLFLEEHGGIAKEYQVASESRQLNRWMDFAYSDQG